MGGDLGKDKGRGLSLTCRAEHEQAHLCPQGALVAFERASNRPLFRAVLQAQLAYA